jgi:hypothetical protein
MNTPSEGTKFKMYGSLDLVVYEVTETQVRYYDEVYTFRKHWMGIKKFNRFIKQGEIVIAS